LLVVQLEIQVASGNRREREPTVRQTKPELRLDAPGTQMD
jgi:hypothetical protein